MITFHGLPRLRWACALNHLDLTIEDGKLTADWPQRSWKSTTIKSLVSVITPNYWIN